MVPPRGVTPRREALAINVQGSLAAQGHDEVGVQLGDRLVELPGEAERLGVVAR